MMTEALKNSLISATLRNVAYTSPASVYLALFTTIPSGGLGTEPTGGYARQAVVFDPPAAGITQNQGALSFGAATAAWGQVRWIGVYDALTGGNLLYWGVLGQPRDVGNGQTLNLAAGSVSISLE